MEIPGSFSFTTRWHRNAALFASRGFWTAAPAAPEDAKAGVLVPQLALALWSSKEQVLEFLFPDSPSRAVWHCRTSARLSGTSLSRGVFNHTEIQSTDSSGRPSTHIKTVRFKPIHLNLEVFLVKILFKTKKKKEREKKSNEAAFSQLPLVSTNT